MTKKNNAETNSFSVNLIMQGELSREDPVRGLDFVNRGSFGGGASN